MYPLKMFLCFFDDFVIPNRVPRPLDRTTTPQLRLGSVTVSGGQPRVSARSRNGREGGVRCLVDSDSRQPSDTASESKAHSLVAVRNSAVGVAPATARFCCSRWERHFRYLLLSLFVSNAAFFSCPCVCVSRSIL